MAEHRLLAKGDSSIGSLFYQREVFDSWCLQVQFLTESKFQGGISLGTT